MTREEILKQGAPVEPNSFETDREERIRQAALAYSFDTNGGVTGDLNTGRDDFTAGAEGADEHPANPWHKVAGGDLPKEQKGDATILPFLVKAKDGAVYMAYYMWYEEEDAPGFYDDCGCQLVVEYWMEIPGLPK